MAPKKPYNSWSSQGKPAGPIKSTPALMPVMKSAPAPMAPMTPAMPTTQKRDTSSNLGKYLHPKKTAAASAPMAKPMVKPVVMTPRSGMRGK